LASSWMSEAVSEQFLLRWAILSPIIMSPFWLDAPYQ
jgi:hypothetical protein